MEIDLDAFLLPCYGRFTNRNVLKLQTFVIYQQPGLQQKSPHCPCVKQVII